MDQHQYEALSKKLDTIEQKIALLHPSQDVFSSFTSHEVAALFEALAKAQGEYPDINANRNNPYYMRLYEDLHSLLKVIRPILSQHGLSFAQIIQTSPEGETWLITRLLHASGQWMHSRTKIIPTKNDYQSIGSALQYAKRQTAMALLGLTIEYDMDDDDAELAMQEYRDIKTKGTKTNTSYSKKGVSHETITKEQLDELEYELGEYIDIAEDMMDALRIQSLADMPKDKWSWSLKRIREIKQTRENR